MNLPYIEIAVCGFHIDVFGHVNNARYLEFLEEARWKIFDTTIQKIVQQQCSFVIVNININYRKAATLGDKLYVNATLHAVGKTSFTISQQITSNHDKDIIYADALVTSVLLDKSGQPLIIDEKTRQDFFSWL